MQATCPRCGRPLARDGMSEPGASPGATCACGGEGGLQAAAEGGAGGGKRTREVAPLEAPSAGSLEIDPWSLPAPEGGYESLVLDEGRPGAEAPAPETGAVDRAAPAEVAAAGAETVPEADAETPAAARSRSRGVLFVGIGAAVIAAGVAAWLALGRSDGPGGATVRVRITEEVPSFAAPPLAPVDPSYVERARPAEAPVVEAPVAAAPARTASAPRGRATAPAAQPPPPPAPVPVREIRDEPAAARITEPPPPAAFEPPAKSTAAAESVAIPLPPPPAPAPIAPPAREAAMGRGRAPALQTRSCVENALRVPRGLEDRLPPEVVLTVTVGADGRPGDVSIAGAVDSRLASALVVAVRTCRFTPGADGSGRPAAGPATMRLRFEP